MDAKTIMIEEIIYEINGKQVMLDSDLAILYKTETKRINEAVKNNLNKFPERFAWKLTTEELHYLWSKFSTANIKNKSRSNPRVFTEQGVAMLATILKSKVATEVSIQIMDAFVAMRRYISNSILEQRYINNLVLEDHEQIKLLQESFSKLEEKDCVNMIYFEGQIYDAYSKIVDICNLAKNELIIIDAYADKIILDIISKLNIKVIVITKPKNKLNDLDLEKYNQQYDNLEVIFNDNFHDRYFILDRNIIYHCGASINYAGSRTFSITKLEDDFVKQSLIAKINSIFYN